MSTGIQTFPHPGVMSAAQYHARAQFLRLSETCRDAHAVGVQLGADFATGFERYAHDGEEWLNRDGENVHGYVSGCFENYSQYSPWEFTAAEWNSWGDGADAIWRAFDQGLIDGAQGVDSGD